MSAGRPRLPGRTAARRTRRAGWPRPQRPTAPANRAVASSSHPAERGLGPQPAVPLAFDEAEHERREPERHQQDPRDVLESDRILVPGFGDQQVPEHQDRETHRQVEQEDRPPRPVGGQVPAEQGAERRRPGDDRSPDAEGDGALAAAEVGVDQRQRGRQDHRPADALEHACRDHHPAADRGAGHQRRTGEHDYADHEHVPAPDAVGDRPNRHEQCGKHERVGRVDPLRARDVHVQRRHDAREGDVDDRGVHDDQGDAHRKDGHDRPAPKIARHGSEPIVRTRPNRGEPPRGKPPHTRPEGMRRIPECPAKTSSGKPRRPVGVFAPRNEDLKRGRFVSCRNLRTLIGGLAPTPRPPLHRGKTNTVGRAARHPPLGARRSACLIHRRTASRPRAADTGTRSRPSAADR